MTERKQKKYPSPGDVLWEGGFIDETKVTPAGIPNRMLGGWSPLLVEVTPDVDWRATCLKVWQNDGSVFFRDFTEEQMEEVRRYADRLVQERLIRAWYPDELEPGMDLPGIRGEYKPPTHGSAQALN